MECCDICGNVGVPEALITCSQCKRNVEHMYCMRTILEEPNDDWQCEECQNAKQLPSCGKLTIDSRKLPNEIGVAAGRWEKIAPAGKTKYISVKEALMLSLGENKYLPSSCNTCHSKPLRHKRGTGRLDRAPIKPRTALLNFSSHRNYASKFLRPPMPQRPNNMEIHAPQQQQSRKRTDEFRSGISLRPSEASKDTQKVKKQPNEVQLSVTRQLVKQSPAPSMNASPVAISGGDGRNDAADSKKYSQIPALDALWKGSFTIQDPNVKARANHLVEAHPPTLVRKRIYELSNQMPEVLHFNLVPSRNFWNNLFKERIPDKRDIALYFFPVVGERSEEEYIQLVESISSMNSALRMEIADVELLVFSSKLFPVNCQCWEGKLYLWGVFHHLKRDAITPTMVLELSVQASDGVNHDQSQVQEVDMDIDMIGGINVGRVDIRGTGEPCNLKNTGEEPAALSSLQIAPAPIIHFAAAATIPSPNVKIESHDLIPPGFEELSPNVKIESRDFIPPGFEELYRLRIQNSSSSVNYVQSGQ